MNTPIYDFLQKYSGGNTLRCHMPGHKGRYLSDGISLNDITEIYGADSLFEADGIIAESERNMARLYCSGTAVYSAGGSTLCIQTMLAVMKSENRKIIAVRNVHRSFLNAAALLDLEVEWIIPDYCGGILSGITEMNQFETALKKCGGNACIYITSPDYTGRTADIKSIAELCGRYGAKLIVDNAHGSHLAFFEENIHPIHLGADMCCDSAHKMLPALTGAAVLHAKLVGCENILKENMSIFASTSPSYLIMESLDLCCRFIYEDIRRCIRENVGYIHDFREHFSDRLVFGEGEPFHITIRAAESGLSGKELADNLRQCGAECEYSDDELVILLMSPINVEGDYIRLTEITENAVSLCEKRKNSLPEPLYLPEPICKMSIREAVFSPSEEIPVTAAEGRICGAVKVPCPPAVPIAVSGEVITAEHINIFKRYGIFTVNVVK